MSIYRQLGVEPIINACGSVTRLGGAPMPPPVLAAFENAARETVPLEQLQAVASQRIAAVTKTEAGLITSGAAGALTLGTAAILTGNHLARMEQLPHCDAFPSEMIIAREQRSGYDHAIRAAGARLTEVGFNEIVAGAGVRRTEAWEYEAAISPQTAGIVYVRSDTSCPSLEDVVTTARRHGLPVLVDAAGELPPRSNLTDIPGTGADLVAFSGGKAIRGPQSTGILCGRRELISAAAQQMFDMDDHPELWDPPQELIVRSHATGIPRHGIGRSLKVSKEEIVALLTALDLFVSGDYDAQLQDYRRWLEQIADALSGTRASTHLVEPATAEQWPVLEIHVNAVTGERSAVDICQDLRKGAPPVFVGHAKLHLGVLVINPTSLQAESISELCRRLTEVLG